MTALKVAGSVAAPGFMNPEGIVIFHEGTMYKKTFKHDKGKWSADARGVTAAEARTYREQWRDTSEAEAAIGNADLDDGC